MLIETRDATSRDVPWLIDQARAFSSIYPSSIKAFEDETYATEFFTELVINHYVRIAQTETGEPCGFIGGTLAPHPFSPNVLTLAELFWWVDPKYQGSRAALLLLNDFNDYGEKHADLITISRISKSQLTHRTLERRGFSLVEEAFAKEIG